MKKLWEFPADLQKKLVVAHLSKHGPLIGEITSLHSSSYTFGHGPRTYPRYVIAKGILVDESMSDEKRKYFARALYEVNNK